MLIGTHHGRFHADEVFAIAILKQIYPDATIVRSRNFEILQTCDIVVDVGGGKYDHHTTDKVFRTNGIPYASAGLIWRDFGEMVLHKWNVKQDMNIIIQTIDERFIQGIDADDNGFQLDKDYRIKSVSGIIGGFNPRWNSNTDENQAFEEAVSFATKILLNQLHAEISRLAAVQIVKDAFSNRTQKEVIELETFCPWTETLLNVDTNTEVLFVVFPDKSGGYRVQAIPKTLGNFEVRKPLPEEWAGKEHTELGTIIGISDAVFCHPARFIAGASSKDSIRKMVEIALKS